MASTAGVANALPNALAAKLTSFLDFTDTRVPTARATVGAVTIIGLGIRVLAVRGFSLREATSGYVAQGSFSQLSHAIRASKAAPINLAILWAVAHTLGSTEFALRLPSLFFGALTIPMLYLAGRALYNEEVGVLASVAGAIGALGVWYAQDAGAASLVILLVTTSIWALQRALATDRPAWWLTWSATAAALIWTQWSGTLVFAAEVAMIVVAMARPQARADGAGAQPSRPVASRLRWLAIGVVVAATALTLPLLNAQGHRLGLSHLSSSIHAIGSQRDLSIRHVLALLVQLTWGFHATGIVADAVALWPLLILVMVLLLGRARHPAHWVLIVIIAVPAAVAIGAAALGDHHALQVGSLVDTLPALYLLLAGAIGAAVPTRTGRHAIAVAVGVVLACGLITQQTDTGVPGLYGYRAAFTQISSAATPDSWIAYAGSDLGPVVGYYEPSLHHLPLDASVRLVPARVPVFVITGSGRTPARGTAAARALAHLQGGRHVVAIFRAPHVVVRELT